MPTTGHKAAKKSSYTRASGESPGFQNQQSSIIQPGIEINNNNKKMHNSSNESGLEVVIINKRELFTITSKDENIYTRNYLS